MDRKLFSRRHGERGIAQVSVVRNDAPPHVRASILTIAEEVVPPTTIRHIICRVLRCLPDTNNWTEYPNIWGEAQQLVMGCKWDRVYDIVEAIYAFLRQQVPEEAAKFLSEINLYFVEEGVGWQLTEGGTIEIRGSDAFEAAVAGAEQQLESAKQANAATEIREAIRDLSRRPEPDLTGAIQHSMAALECVARDVSGDAKATLGEILKKNPGLVPLPLDQALEKVWGY